MLHRTVVISMEPEDYSSSTDFLNDALNLLGSLVHSTSPIGGNSLGPAETKSDFDAVTKSGLYASPSPEGGEDSGIIAGTATLLNASKLDLKLTALIQISMDRHTPDRFEIFESKVKSFPEVVECLLITGQSADYQQKVMVPDMEYYQEFLLNKITRIEGVSDVHSSFMLREVLNTTELPLQHIRYD